MRKIDSVWKGVYEGYLSIRKAQRDLELRWARAIKVAEKRRYQRQYQDWHASLERERRRYRLLWILSPTIGVLTILCAAFSVFSYQAVGISILDWRNALIILFVLAGFVVAQWVGIHNLERRPPVQAEDGRKLLHIAAAWWKDLMPPPIQINKHGDRGEKALLQALGEKLSHEYMALHQSMVRKKLDADILLMGPGGIWVLESKYNSGTILCQNGKWTQEKAYYKPGGQPAVDEIEKRAYDRQWLAEKRIIQQIIADRLPQDMHWVIKEIKGGLVFTHRDIELDIDRSCQADYGRISDWVEKIATSKVNPNLTPGVLLCIVDALLDHASQLSPQSPRKSARQLAVDVFKNAETDIASFIRTSL